MKFAVALLALVAVAVNAASVKNLKTFSYGSCSAAPEAIVINSFSILPDPIVVPGSVTYSISLTGTVAVTSPTVGDLTLSYRPDASGEWVDLPCVDGLGSCHHDDICVFLDTLFPADCPSEFIENNVPCHCPFEATTYEIPDGQLDILTPLETLQAGDYKFRIVLTKDDVELECYDFQVTLVAAAP